MLGIVGIILLICFFVFCFIGLAKENRIHMRYRGVFGRFSAYLFADFILVGAFALIATIASLFDSELAKLIDGNHIYFIGIGLLVLALGILIYFIARKRCPAYLMPGLFKNMLLDGLGIALKISLFFLPFIFKIGIPSAEEIAAEERRREEERLALEQQKEETLKDLYRKTGQKYVLNRDGDKAKELYDDDYKNVDDILKS